MEFYYHSKKTAVEPEDPALPVLTCCHDRKPWSESEQVLTAWADIGKGQQLSPRQLLKLP